MSEEERQRWLRLNPKGGADAAPKKKWRFLQKYWHKCAGSGCMLPGGAGGGGGYVVGLAPARAVAKAFCLPASSAD